MLRLAKYPAIMDVEVGTFEAKSRWSELLAQVERGQRVFITRRGKHIALLSAVDEAREGPRRAAELVASFRKFRKTARPGSDALKRLVEDGRR